jgi:hypothetical protein
VNRAVLITPEGHASKRNVTGIGRGEEVAMRCEVRQKMAGNRR